MQTTCEQCLSILVRTDVNLERVGTVSDLPPDASPIQIGSEGVYEKRAFAVAGRIIYDYPEGSWNEWHIMMSDGASAWLSDAQAEYAVTFAEAMPGLPPAGSTKIGDCFTWNRTQFEATSITRARYRGVQGELPFQYWDKHTCVFIDLRTPTVEFATLDYSEESPVLYIGKVVDFDALRLTNLRQFEGWS